MWAGAVLVAVTILLVAWARGSTIESSVTEQIAVGIVRWVFLAAGVTTASTFVPMFVTNGLTRARLSASTVVAMVLLSVAGAAVAALSFAVERLIAAGADWQLVLADDGPPLDAGTIATRIAAIVPLFGAYFVSGWLIGICFHVFDTGLAVVLIAPCLLPALITGALVDDPANIVGVVRVVEGGFEPIGGLSAPLAIPLAAGVVAAACVVADRATRRMPVA